MDKYSRSKSAGTISPTQLSLARDWCCCCCCCCCWWWMTGM